VSPRRFLGVAAALFTVLLLSATPALAQGRSKDKKPADDHSGVSVELALSATKDVLVKQGFEVVKVESQGDRQIVYYRAGNQGKGKGKGPPVRMVIERINDRIVLEDAPDEVRIEIGVKLGIKL
jgi:hypothetical protein